MENSRDVKFAILAMLASNMIESKLVQLLLTSADVYSADIWTTATGKIHES